jgi:iron(III) transport system ATP-binding protein/putative spermidine/putrescine transport system ATP-binding protein
VIAIGDSTVTAPADAVAVGPRPRLVVRPDWVEPGDDLEGVVTGAFYRGPHTDYRIDTAAGTIEMRRPGTVRWLVGDRIGVRILRGWPVADGG